MSKLNENIKKVTKRFEWMFDMVVFFYMGALREKAVRAVISPTHFVLPTIAFRVIFGYFA